MVRVSHVLLASLALLSAVATALPSNAADAAQEAHQLKQIVSRRRSERGCERGAARPQSGARVGCEPKRGPTRTLVHAEGMYAA